jgi:hypothetical protein
VYTCTASDTDVTTHIMVAVRVSMRKPTSRFTPPAVAHWYRVPLKVLPCSTSNSVHSDAANEIATPAMVTV